MESLLLGTLGYLGSTQSNEQPIKANDELDNYYSTNLENNIHRIDINQANSLSKNPDFYQQFDSLKFDNVGRPSCINESTTKRSGFDFNLQRDLDFKNGYSNFQDKNMHYGVVSMENFTHNNMVPYTKRRDVKLNLNNNASLKYEKHTGNNKFWKNKKETEPFFEPFRDLTYTNGVPAFSGEIKNRYVPSSKNNHGNLPFQSDIRVLPGMADQVAAPYPVVRVNPRNIDELRSDVNQKVTYINKPLETIKKGEMRGIDPNITKYKLPNYREVTTNNLVQNYGPNSSGAMKVRSKVIGVESQRGENDTYYTGPANDSNQGNLPDVQAVYFNESKKENYLNDNTHAVTGVNIRPVMTNVDSYTNYETERVTTSKDLRASGLSNTNHASYHIDRKAIANTTIKENTINKPLVSNINSTFQNAHVNYTDDAKNTVRQTTIDKPLVSNINSTFQNAHVNYTDDAKNTVRQTTIDKPLVSNVNSTFQNAHVNYTDDAKKTVRQTTIDKPLVSNVNSTFQNAHVKNNDQARETIKQTTIDKLETANISSIKQYIYSNLNDEARKTIKETNIDKPTVSNISSNYENIYIKNNDIAKPTMKQNTVIIMKNTNITPIQQNIHVQNNDQAKPTIKQSTIIKKSSVNIVPMQQNIHVQNNDQARETIKQTTENNNYISNTSTDVKGVYSNITDIAKDTIKQTTENNKYISNTSTDVKGVYSNVTDTARDTIKQTTENNKYISNTSTDVKGVYSNVTDIARDTIKQTTENNNYISNTSTDVKGVYSNVTDSAKDTIKQSTINNDYISNTTTEVKGVYSNVTDDAKSTIKQTTINKDYISNTIHEVKGTYKNITDDIKKTIKETTLSAVPVKNIVSQISTVYAKNDEEARPTIKETVLHESRTNVSDTYQSNWIMDKNNEARTTIKESTLITDHNGSAQSYVKLPKSEQAEKNMTIDERREITANFNRPSNAKSDQIRGDINRDTVKFNERKQLFGYVSIPSMNLDYTITPFAKVHTDRKTDINDSNDYRLDSIFIDTLKDNPLVNDIYHQKNYNFNS